MLKKSHANASVRSKAAVRTARRAPKAFARPTPTVEVADVGGYRVFGSPVKPVHVTEQQIQDALAASV